MARVFLNEQAHTYHNSETNEQYLGTTSLIALFKDKFNTQKVAKDYAAKHGETPEFWIRRWEQISQKAQRIGHEFHAEQELYTTAQNEHIRFGKPFKVRNQHLQRTDDLYRYQDGYYSEMDLWNHFYKIAGRADKVFIETIGTTRFIDIDDYKTNEEIEFLSYRFRDGRYKMMKRPLMHLMDCSYTHYELQQSVYAFMLEGFGFTPRSLRLLHHGHTDNGNSREKVGKPIILNYRKSEVLAMVEHYQQSKAA